MRKGPAGAALIGAGLLAVAAIMLEKMVNFSGASYSPGANNLVVDITPLPCLWVPIGDANTGSQAILSAEGTDPARAPNIFAVPAAVKQANTLVSTHPPAPGEWYELPVNPADTAAQQQECLNEPLYAWVPPGGTLPGINIPPQTLAQLAVAKMALPTAGQMTLNPASGQTYPNLPKYLRVTLGGGYETFNGLPYATVTATLGNVAATVWAEPSPRPPAVAGAAEPALSGPGVRPAGRAS